MLRRLLVKTMSVIAPRLLWRLRIRSWKVEQTEAEVALVPLLCDRAKISIDIGASMGLYTMHMLGYSRAVWAFEPRPDSARELTALFCGSRPSVRVEAVALSRQSGTASMRVCPADLGRSTIEPGVTLPDPDRQLLIEVPLRRLDEYGLNGVALIKVDVEGHEEALLEGAMDTLRRERPSLLIEIEERHNPGALRRLPEMLAGLGYSAYFLLDGRLRPLSEFRLEVHQNVERAGRYVNNFLFVTSTTLPRLKSHILPAT